MREGVPMGRTATMTGTVKGRPGRAAAGGAASNVKVNSRGVAIVFAKFDRLQVLIEYLGEYKV